MTPITFSHPSGSAFMTLRTRCRSHFVLHLSFSPFSQPIFFNAFQARYYVERVTVEALENFPNATKVYFSVSVVSADTLVEEIDELFSELYED